jgi:hypothetical protein
LTFDFVGDGALRRSHAKRRDADGAVIQIAAPWI